jgi:hypothetical protein
MSAVPKSVILHGSSTAESRWARFGPYYAMFPVDFAFDVIKKYSKAGEYIIDPFAGRCSSVYVGGVLGRYSLGIEINPVGWLYGAVKLNPAEKWRVLKRLEELDAKKNYYSKAIKRMPAFFRMCYCDDVLKFLLSARKNLNWENNRVDATLMSIILVYLHGKLGEGLSNQMRMTKAMGPAYSIDWWKKNKLTKPPKINPVDMIAKKIEWRYCKGIPRVFDSKVIFGDSTLKLNNVVNQNKKKKIKFSLLFTSPPYCDVTDYHADQWLRLWLLGGPERPEAIQQQHKGRFVSKERYKDLLDQVFGNCAKLMKKKSVIYVRTDKRDFTFDTTLEILKKHFPHHAISIIDRPFQRRTQTDLHGNFSSEKGEIDIVLKRK